MGWLHAVIDVPPEQADAAATFWSAALGWQPGEPWPGHPELRSFEPTDGAPYVHLQTIDGPPRVHLDVESPDPDHAVEAAVLMGAEVAGEQDGWTTLRSPGGLPFCVLRAVDRRAPEPVTWQDGHRSRMVQVCVDMPATAHAREVVFWRAFLRGRWVDSPSTDFVGKWHDDAGSPVQLLFQRLLDDDGPVRAHLDHGTDDVAAEVARLLDLGAADVGAGHGGWHVLRDAAGLPFCVTANSPEVVARRDLG